MQDKRKDQILSSWTELPFEAPQVHLPPNIFVAGQKALAFRLPVRVGFRDPPNSETELSRIP
jgi:hypothetical protein